MHCGHVVQDHGEDVQRYSSALGARLGPQRTARTSGMRAAWPAARPAAATCAGSGAGLEAETDDVVDHGRLGGLESRGVEPAVEGLHLRADAIAYRLIAYFPSASP